MDWSFVIPNLVGGGVTAGTAAALFALSQRLDKKKKAEEGKKKSAFLAYSGFQKLLRAAQATISLDRHISKEYREAHETGRIMDDPSMVVRPILFDRIAIEDIAVEEGYFLAKRGNAQLLFTIYELQQRARNNQAIVKEFNFYKQKFSDYLDSKSHAVRDISSDQVGFGLEGDDAIPAIGMVGHMNSMLGELIPSLDEDVPRIREVIAEYLREAQIEFGDDFPKTKIEWVEN